MSDALAGDLGLETAVLDPIEGLSDETADEDYLSLMRENLAALQKANGMLVNPVQVARTARSPSAAGRSCAGST